MSLQCGKIGDYTTVLWYDNRSGRTATGTMLVDYWNDKLMKCWRTSVRCILIVTSSAFALVAGEHRGQVMFKGVPVPGYIPIAWV